MGSNHMSHVESFSPDRLLLTAGSARSGPVGISLVPTMHVAEFHPLSDRVFENVAVFT